jgi:pimeloyl-ACP methyl ester carboxylesterase
VTFRTVARRTVKTIFWLLAGLYLLVVVGGPYWLVSRIVTTRIAYDDKLNAGLTPASFDLPFEDVGFASSDGIALRGWWVPAKDARGTVVLVHGLNRSRIEMARKLPFLHAQGWNALLFDLRKHGASEGTRTGFGYYERLDVRAAAAEARRRDPGPVALWGISMGAASALLAAADDAGVAGVVCDSSYRSLDDTVRHHMTLLRGMRPWLRLLPAGALSREMLFWVRRKGGFDPAEVDILAAARRLQGRPVLFVSNAGDQRMPTDIAFDLKAAAGPRARVLVIPGHSHGGAYREGQPAYERAVAELLKELESWGTGGAGLGVPK